MRRSNLKFEKGASLWENRTLLYTAAGAGAVLAARALIRRVNQYSLGIRVVLITGGSRGLGLVMARELARKERTSRSVRATKASYNAHMKI